MKLLIIGGTRFIGRHLVAAALQRDHEVTLFNRGTHASAPAAGGTIRGDRHNDLAKLQGRRWDAVIDMCGQLPRAVRAAAQTLGDAVDRYVFISSVSVYADVSAPGVDETAPVKTLTTEQLERANAMETAGEPSYAELYGGLKALCERAAEEVMPGRVLVIRPGLIVGPYDYTDRFTYWVARVARGGEVLAPGRAARPVQFIDGRDLAEWLIRMVEERAAGVYNATGLPGSVTMQDVLEESQLASDSDAHFTWVSEAFLQQEQVAAWSEMPLWLPEEDAPQLQGFMFVSTGKAVAAGLRLRPLDETIRDTLAWFQAERSAGELKAGIDAAKEESLRRKWREADTL
jgi:2'-hydroxyisoflavone reductase